MLDVVHGALIMNPGRCGSTLVSNLLGEHPDILSVQEYMISLGSLAYTAPAKLTGAEFWDLLSGPSAIEALLRRLDRVPREIVYTGTLRTVRGGRSGMPRILGVALAALGADPDEVFRDLATTVPGFAEQDLGAHHRQLLEVLTTRFGKKSWVERSGGNCTYIDRMASMFPDARIVYLRRNCVDTVLSMCRHPYFQLATIGEQFERLCAINPFDEDSPVYTDDIHGGFPVELRALLPQNLTAAVLDGRADLLEPFVARWVAQDLHARTVLSMIPAEQQLEMDYDDLVAAPAAELARLGRFLDLADPSGWAARVADRVTVPVGRSTPAIREQVAAWQGRITTAILATGSYQPTTVA